MYGQLDQASRQVLIEQQFLAGTVRDSYPPIVALDREAIAEQGESVTRLSLRDGSTLGRRLCAPCLDALV